jgi:hypothetical protein
MTELPPNLKQLIKDKSDEIMRICRENGWTGRKARRFQGREIKKWIKKNGWK